MAARRSASHLLFGAACLLWTGALALLVASRIPPSQGFEDLGRFVFGALLAAIAVVPFGLALLIGRNTHMPNWMIVAAWAGLVLSAIPAIAFLRAWSGSL